MRYSLVVVLIISMIAGGCATRALNPAPRYVWYCHIAGGGGCTGEMIRCWDRESPGWVADSHCAAVEKPANLVHNQSYPPVSRSALLPGR